MAPNRKEISAIVGNIDLAGIVATGDAKFAPLTDLYPSSTSTFQKAVAPSDEEKEEYVSSSENEVSYWDWTEPEGEVDVEGAAEVTKQELIEQILVEEEHRRVLSLANIEHLLLSHKSERQWPQDVEYEVNDDTIEAYWDFADENDTTEEESSVLSVSQVERLLINEATRLISRSVQSSAPAESKQYWEWEAEEALLNESEKKDRLILKLLEAETSRQILSLTSIERQLQSEADRQLQYSNVNSVDGGDSYWDFTASPEEVKVTEAGHVNDERHPRANYWEWNELKQSEIRSALINTVVEEERLRQYFQVGSLQQNLLSYQSPDEEVGVVEAVGDDEYWTSPNDVGCVRTIVGKNNSARADYWDFISAPASKEEATRVVIEKILKEEEARSLFAVEQVEKYLVGKFSKVEDGTNVSCDCASYWDH